MLRCIILKMIYDAKNVHFSRGNILLIANFTAAKI